jgi:hypothetical protein
MQIIIGEALGSVYIRSGAGTEHQIVGSLKAGDKIEAIENVFQWLHLSRVNGAPVVGEWASAGSSQQYIKWAWVDVTDPVVDPPAPPAAGPVDVLVTWSDGSKWKANQFTKEG